MRKPAGRSVSKNAGDRECDSQRIALLAGRVVTGCTVDGARRTAGKGLGVEEAAAS